MKISKEMIREIVRAQTAFTRRLNERGDLDAAGPDEYTQYVVYPSEYVRTAEELLTPEEIEAVGQKKLITMAVDFADELAYNLTDSEEGFGSSDRTYEFQAYLNQLGFKTGFPEGYLAVIRENRNARKDANLSLVSEQYGFGGEEESGSLLLDFAREYAKLGGAIQEQVEAVVNMYVQFGADEEFADLVYRQNSNALDIASRRLSRLADGLGDEGAVILEALEAANAIFDSGDGES
jgi:hypothetical protein